MQATCKRTRSENRGSHFSYGPGAKNRKKPAGTDRKRTHKVARFLNLTGAASITELLGRRSTLPSSSPECRLWRPAGTAKCHHRCYRSSCFRSAVRQLETHPQRKRCLWNRLGRYRSLRTHSHPSRGLLGQRKPLRYREGTRRSNSAHKDFQCRQDR